jgi:hypothetical protein
MNLGVRSTGPQERACDLRDGSWVLTEAFSPRFGEVKADHLVVVRQRGGEGDTLGRVVAVGGDALAWRQGRLWVNDEPLELRGEPARPVRLAALKTRKVLLRSRDGRAQEERASLWRGPLGERKDEGRRGGGAVPSGLGLKAAITQVPRQHLYIIYGGDETGVLGRLTPLADVVAASWLVLPAKEPAPNEALHEEEADAQRAPAVRTQRRQR